VPRWSRPLAIATTAIFCVSTAFPVVAGLSKNTGTFPKWWGAPDVFWAPVLGAMALAVMAAAQGRINEQADEATYRAYRFLTHGILLMLVVFFLAGERITWINCLTGLVAHLAPIVCAAFVVHRDENSHSQIVDSVPRGL
jgi:hypothetical protein